MDESYASGQMAVGAAVMGLLVGCFEGSFVVGEADGDAEGS